MHIRSSPHARRIGVRSSRQRGEQALLAARRNPELLSDLPAGGWWASHWKRRWARRLGLALPGLWLLLPAGIGEDVAFWSGVRAAATPREWRRLTRSSYVVLCYHRTAGLALPGQERMDVRPSAVRSQLRLLRWCGWRSLTPAELEQFHADPAAVLPPRRFVVTADDGYTEAVAEMTRHAGLRPQMFVVTRSVGGTGEWLGQAALAGWREIEDLQRAGGVIGSHARRHLPLDTLTDDVIVDELEGSLTDLRSRLDIPVPVLAYPHGRHDDRVRATARTAGYALAYSTAQGRNGAGTDRWALRRVEPKIWDSLPSFAWKVLTGQSPPRRWERLLLRRWRRESKRRRDQPGG